MAVDMRTDSDTDTGADGRWMTYPELAAARGIEATSALKLALRRKWRKQIDNHGRVRIFVPSEEAGTKDKGADTSIQTARLIDAFEGATVALRQRAEAAEARADRAEAKTEGQSAAAQTSAEAAAKQIATLQEHLTELRRAETERQRPGRLARAWRAWQAP